MPFKTLRTDRAECFYHFDRQASAAAAGDVAVEPSSWAAAVAVAAVAFASCLGPSLEHHCPLAVDVLAFPIAE